MGRAKNWCVQVLNAQFNVNRKSVWQSHRLSAQTLSLVPRVFASTSCCYMTAVVENNQEPAWHTLTTLHDTQLTHCGGTGPLCMRRDETYESPHSRRLFGSS